MNDCGLVEKFDESNSQIKKKKRKHRKKLVSKDISGSIQPLENELLNKAFYSENDSVFHIGEKGDNKDENYVAACVQKEHLESIIITHSSSNNLQVGCYDSKVSDCTETSALSIRPRDDNSENVECIHRSHSVSHFVTNPLLSQSISYSVPELGADIETQSEHSLQTMGSVNRIYQPPRNRGPESVFSSKINKNETCNTAASQLHSELRNELLKYFPEAVAKIMIITWNMASVTTYPELLHDLFKNNCEEMSDLYILCFQETTSNKQELLMRIQMSVGGHHVIYSYVENGTLLCVLVGHKKFIWNLALIGKGIISTRVTPITKGAVAISFQFFGNTILFLGSHFSSGTDGSSGDKGRNSSRIEDYKAILHSKELIKALTNPDMKLGPDETNLSHYFDYTFWAGDLNFRIIRDDVTVARLILSEIESNDGQAFEELLEYDELTNCQAAGLVFQEFEEGRIMYLPTYRFVLHTDDYNEKRTPSYTDRILFRSHKCRGIDCVYYNSVKSYQYSDHKPVCAVMEINLEPQQSEHLKSAGNFNKEIYEKCFEFCETMQSKIVSGKTVSNPPSQLCSIQ